ncbi:hypothetical protein IC232_03655 [Microvirga sp. BT688]|uniref:hypothetical protein n=1 Tax=Microvirga sp. TaxID=1873136 RepID=UPI0016823E70|nr:hypothetical protein [Microvirga sp.]MBD2745786.1 hypothetical protein [Microvirga sp.]
MMTKSRPFLAILCLLTGLVGAGKEAASAPGDIFVEFYGSQVSWTSAEYVGHAFTCIALHLNNGIKEDCYGFYPKQGGKGLIDGPGIIKSELKENPTRFSRISTTVKAKISEEQRRQILALANDWNARGYTLTDSNCIDFVHDAAGKIGLKRPDRSSFQLPAAYLQELDRLN